MENKNEHDAVGTGRADEPGANQSGGATGAVTSNSELDAQWHRVRSRLRAELGEATFNSWFKLLSVDNVHRGRVVLKVPTRFVRSWIEAHYLPRIRDYWQNEDPTVKRIDIELQPEWAPAEPKSETRMQTAPPSRLPPIEAKTSPRPQAVASETTACAMIWARRWTGALRLRILSSANQTNWLMPRHGG